MFEECRSQTRQKVITQRKAVGNDNDDDAETIDNVSYLAIICTEYMPRSRQLNT